MATNLKDSLKKKIAITGKGMRIGIVVSEWNDTITNALLEGALETLAKADVDEQDIITRYVPGSFELPAGADYIIKYADVDAVICLGCVIEGETKHFDYVCAGATQGIMKLGLKSGIPVIFGVLTTKNVAQALARAGGDMGNKGIDSAMAAMQMVQLKKDLKAEFKKH